MRIVSNSVKRVDTHLFKTSLAKDPPKIASHNPKSIQFKKSSETIANQKQGKFFRE
jgi:hypothetical protein